MTTDATALVVLEHGSDWPALGHDGLDLVAIGQEADEPEGSLTLRAEERVRALHARGGRVARAVLSCSGRMTMTALESRGLIAWVLLRAILRGGGGQLVLVAHASCPPLVRTAILALADALTTALAASPSTSVSARFIDEAEGALPRAELGRSGVRIAARPRLARGSGPQRGRPPATRRQIH